MQSDWNGWTTTHGPTDSHLASGIGIASRAARRDTMDQVDQVDQVDHRDQILRRFDPVARGGLIKIDRVDRTLGRVARHSQKIQNRRVEHVGCFHRHHVSAVRHNQKP